MFLFCAAMAAAVISLTGYAKAPVPVPGDNTATGATELAGALVRVNLELEDWQMVDILFYDVREGEPGDEIDYLTKPVDPGSDIWCFFLPPGDYFMKVYLHPYMPSGASHLYIPFTLPAQGGQFDIYCGSTLTISPFLPL